MGTTNEKLNKIKKNYNKTQVATARTMQTQCTMQLEETKKK
jgi:hypothetical protein